MFRFMTQTVRAFEQALRLSRIANEVTDPTELRERLLAVIHAGRRVELGHAVHHPEEGSRRIAA